MAEAPDARNATEKRELAAVDADACRSDAGTNSSEANDARALEAGHNATLNILFKVC